MSWVCFAVNLLAFSELDATVAGSFIARSS